MIEGLLIRLLIAIVALAIAFPSLYMLLRTFDKASSINAVSAFDAIETSPRALAIYYGCRFVGCAGLIAFVVGKAIGF